MELYFGALQAVLFSLLAVSTATSSYGNNTISFASYYGDHMVLQHDPQRSLIWGYASNVGDTVTVSLSEKGSYKTTVVSVPFIKDGGLWKIKLPVVAIGGPYSITVTQQSGGKAQINDVWFGDVWVCSGQSNMMFTLDMVFNATSELEDASNFPLIRVFTAAMVKSNEQKYDLLGVEEIWSIPKKDTVGHKAWTYFSAVCWLYGKYLFQTLGYPIGLIETTWGGTAIEAWSSPDALAMCPQLNGQPSLKDPGLFETSIVLPNSSLWNAMVHPFLNMTIYGAIWYQGEANAGKPDSYNCTFPAMINDWRQKFHEGSQEETEVDFPFGFVQLAPYRNEPNVTQGFPDIRWHQTADIGYVPNDILKRVFMAVAIDTPDFASPYGSIHPRDKQDVASRLVLSALPVAYNIQKKGKYQGPFPSAFEIDIGFKTLTIDYDKKKVAIHVLSSDGFEVCCSNNNQSLCDPSDAKWIPVPISKSSTTSVTLSYKSCRDNQYVVGVRYLWRESPCALKACAIYSRENNLPAPPYLRIGLIGYRK